MAKLNWQLNTKQIQHRSRRKPSRRRRRSFRVNAKMSSSSDSPEILDPEDFAVSLRNLFSPNPASSIKFEVNGELRSLEELLGTEEAELAYRRFDDSIKNQYNLEPLKLLKDDVTPTDLPPYYIERTLLFRKQVDKRIFTDPLTEDHVFILKGITERQLKTLTGTEMFDRTSKQLENVTAKFMLLDEEEHFETISQNSHNPVHLIECKNHACLWIRSSKMTNIVIRFLTTETIEMTETEFAQETSGQAVVFSDLNQGIKCFVGSLAKKLKDSTVICLDETELNKSMLMTSALSVVESIASLAAFDKNSENVLLRILLQQRHQFDIFCHVHSICGSTIQKLLVELKTWKNIRLFVVCTVVPPFIGAQNWLNEPWHEINPFTTHDRTKFFLKYFIISGISKPPISSTLEKFAEMCATESEGITDVDNHFNYNFVIMQMLAEIHLDEAEQISTLEDKGDVYDRSNDNILVTNFIDLFKLFFQAKIKRMELKYPQNADLKYLKNSLVYRSMELLLPEWTDRLKRFIVEYDDAEISLLCESGLMKQDRFSNTLIFTHQIMAKYILAEFLVQNMGRCGLCIEIIFQVILRSTQGSFGKTRYLPHKQIGYFLDGCVKEYQSDQYYDPVLIANHLKCIGVSYEDLCYENLTTCSYANFRNLFMLISKILFVYDIPNNLQYYKSPHPVKFVSLVRNPVGRRSTYDYPWIPGCTALHVAVYWGNYEIFKALEEEYGESLQFIKNLIHVCVRDSAHENPTVIENKLKIIDLLLERNKTLLSEQFDDGTPVLQKEIHSSLLKRLVDLGADINEVSNTHGTILHRVNPDHIDGPFLSWTTSKGFKLMNYRDSKGMTCLLRVIATQNFQWRFSEAAEQLKNAGADFNAEDNNGHSALFYSLIRNGYCINELLTYGANINKIGSNLNTLAHSIIEYAREKTWSSAQLVKTLTLLLSNGFNKIDEVNGKGHTPLMCSMGLKDLSPEALDFFHGNGANFNAENEDGWSPLLIAIRYGHGVDIIQTLVEKYDANLYHHTKLNQSCLHFAASCANYSALEYLLTKLNNVNPLTKSGNTPIHLLFHFEDKDYSDTLKLLLEKGAKFDEENLIGDSPLIRWIKSRNVAFPNLMKTKDILPLTSAIASSALTLLVMDEHILENYLLHSNQNNVNAFKEFVYHLVDKRGWVRLKNRDPFSSWDSLGVSQQELNEIQIHDDFKSQLKSKFLGDIIEFSSLGNFLWHNNYLPVELVLICLLKSNSDIEFIQLCRVLSKNC